MKAAAILSLAVLAFAGSVQADDSADSTASPIAKVLSMLNDLESKLISEGEQAQKVYTEFTEYCDDKSKDLANEIKTGKSQVEELKATIAFQDTEITSLTAKLEEIVAAVAKDSDELKAATEVRNKEAADFEAEEKEMVEAISMMDRAIGIIQREMSKGGASMMQTKSAADLTAVLKVIVRASVLSHADASRLTALVQQQQDASDGDSQDPGAPAAAAYENQSGDIVETLQGLMDKAQAQLDAARSEETKARNNYEMMKQSLEDSMKFANKDMEEAKKGMAKAGETKATAEGDLAVTTKDLASDTQALEDLHHDCMSKASDFESETNARDEELKALAKAEKIIKEATSLSQVSFVQIASERNARDQHVVKFVQELAKKLKEKSLSQLASRMQSAFRFGAMGGEDPFAKVKSLITDMIAKLEKQAKADATEKKYCDEEMATTAEKKADKEDVIEKLSTKIEQMTASADKLKSEVARLQEEVAKLANDQAEMDKIREKEKAAYDTNKPELEKGLKGIQTALKVLTEYYNGKDSGAGNGIISMLEVCESDFAKNLAEVEAAESAAAEEYETETQANKVEKTAKDQDIKYKSQEATGLDKSIAEAKSDREGTQSELDAVMEYFARIKDKCIAKPETYEEIKKRRDAEIGGLKEALSILEGETAFVQLQSRRALRGVRPHA